jgi:hypothetical protein
MFDPALNQTAYSSADDLPLTQRTIIDPHSRHVCRGTQQATNSGSLAQCCLPSLGLKTLYLDYQNQSFDEISDDDHWLPQWRASWQSINGIEWNSLATAARIRQGKLKQIFAMSNLLATTFGDSMTATAVSTKIKLAGVCKFRASSASSSAKFVEAHT